jgi:hypothetical protein
MGSAIKTHSKGLDVAVRIQGLSEHLRQQFNALTEEMMVLRSEVAKTDEQRQLFVHYKKGIGPVYDELQRLNPLAVFMQAKNIVEILPKVIKFFASCLHVIDLKHKADHQRRMAPAYKSIDDSLNLMERLPDSPQKEQLVTLLTKFKTEESVDDLIKRIKK